MPKNIDKKQKRKKKKQKKTGQNLIGQQIPKLKNIKLLNYFNRI